MRFELKAIGPGGRRRGARLPGARRGRRRGAASRGAATPCSACAPKRALGLPWRSAARALSGGALQPGAARAAQRRPAAGGGDRDAGAEGAPRRLPRRARAPRARCCARASRCRAALRGVPAGLLAALRRHRAREREDQRPRARARRATSPTPSQLEAIRKRVVNASIYPLLLHRGRRPGQPVPAALRGAALRPHLRGARRQPAALLARAARLGPGGRRARRAGAGCPRRPDRRSRLRAAHWRACEPGSATRCGACRRSASA